MSHDLLPLETLDRLSRQEGVDVRPILIRVLTDLFVQKPHHAPEEIARYEELALQLLDAVDLGTRAIVAGKLADEPRAPRSVIARLLADDFTVSAPILARFADAPRDTLIELALDGGVMEASAVAARSGLDDDMIRILAHHPDDLVPETLVANPEATLRDATLAGLATRAKQAPGLAAALLRRQDLDAGALSPLYLQASPEQRGAIRAALAARPARAAGRPVRHPDAVDAALVEAASESGRGRLIAEALADALGLKPADAARLAAEPSGEPFVMMLRAAGLDRDAVARALLVSQPDIAASVPRFFNLVEIAEATPRSAAAELVAALAGLDAKPASPRHEPLFDPSGAPERPNAARPIMRTSRPLARPGEATRQRG